MQTIIGSKILVHLLKTLDHPNPDINMAAVNVCNSLLIDMNEEIEQAEQNVNEDNGKSVD